MPEPFTSTVPSEVEPVFTDAPEEPVVCDAGCALEAVVVVLPLL